MPKWYKVKIEIQNEKWCQVKRVVYVFGQKPNFQIFRLRRPFCHPTKIKRCSIALYNFYRINEIIKFINSRFRMPHTCMQASSQFVKNVQRWVSWNNNITQLKHFPAKWEPEDTVKILCRYKWNIKQRLAFHWLIS